MKELKIFKLGWISVLLGLAINMGIILTRLLGKENIDGSFAVNSMNLILMGIAVMIYAVGMHVLKIRR